MKALLLDRFNTLEMNYVHSSLSLYAVIAMDMDIEETKKISLDFGQDEWRRTVKLSSILKRTESDKESVFKNSVSSLNRNLIKETFELLKAYCKANNQLNKFKEQDWYWFAKILRDCVTHDLIISMNDADIRKVKFPVQYRGASITKDMIGKGPTNEFNGPLGYALHCDMRKFAEEYID